MEQLLEKRLQELVSLTNALSTENSKEQDRHKELIKEIKASGTSDEDKNTNLVKIHELKKINSFSYLRLKEIDINIRVMNELYSMLKFKGVDPEIGEQEKIFLEFNYNNFKPTFTLDKGEITFVNKEAEEFILNQLDKTSDSDERLIEEVKKYNNGESK